MPRWVLGLGGSDHDFSAALMCDGDIRVAIEQERLSRRKYGRTLWFESPVQKAIEYCLETEGIPISKISAIVSGDTLPARVRNDLRSYELLLYPHHLCHAASAYMMLPADARAGILVYDGFGSVCGPAEDDLHCSRETFSFFIFYPGGHECIGRNLGTASVERDDFPVVVSNSMGLLYELVTAVLGYDPMEAGKTMGLSSYGRPLHTDLLKSFIQHGEEPSVFFRCPLQDVTIAERLDEILVQAPNVFAAKADVAASVQEVMNETAQRSLKFFQNRGISHLCISGGCALNTVTNSFIVEKSPLNIPVSVAPHCGDAGLGLGAFWLHEFQRTGRTPELTFRGMPLAPALARPGRVYREEERIAAVQQFYPRLSLDPSVRGTPELAQLLAHGELIGVFNGRSEIGPRALGGRSIIADPVTIAIRERINRVVKKREPYRPLAPVVLERRYDDYFEDRRNADPYMLKVARVREKCVREAPAVVHVDGTARVQVVPENGDPFLADLLHQFESVTGRGVLLNTSFNRQGEPIVESPLDAVDAFVGMQLDGLYLDGDFYRLADNPSLCRTSATASSSELAPRI
jgi:carbamoyltransferase